MATPSRGLRAFSPTGNRTRCGSTPRRAPTSTCARSTIGCRAPSPSRSDERSDERLIRGVSRTRGGRLLIIDSSRQVEGHYRSSDTTDAVGCALWRSGGSARPGKPIGTGSASNPSPPTRGAPTGSRCGRIAPTWAAGPRTRATRRPHFRFTPARLVELAPSPWRKGRLPPLWSHSSALPSMEDMADVSGAPEVRSPLEPMGHVQRSDPGGSSTSLCGMRNHEPRLPMSAPPPLRGLSLRPIEAVDQTCDHRLDPQLHCTERQLGTAVPACAPHELEQLAQLLQHILGVDRHHDAHAALPPRCTVASAAPPVV